jgi:hypothetical protein
VFAFAQFSTALLAASLDKLNAREKELLESKGFLESKRTGRVSEVLQLEDSLKASREYIVDMKKFGSCSA